MQRLGLIIVNYIKLNVARRFELKSIIVCLPLQGLKLIVHELFNNGKI